MINPPLVQWTQLQSVNNFGRINFGTDKYIFLYWTKRVAIWSILSWWNRFSLQNSHYIFLLCSSLHPTKTPVRVSKTSKFLKSNYPAKQKQISRYEIYLVGMLSNWKAVCKFLPVCKAFFGSLLCRIQKAALLCSLRIRSLLLWWPQSAKHQNLKYICLCFGSTIMWLWLASEILSYRVWIIPNSL